MDTGMFPVLYSQSRSEFLQNKVSSSYRWVNYLINWRVENFWRKNEIIWKPDVWSEMVAIAPGHPHHLWPVDPLSTSPVSHFLGIWRWTRDPLPWLRGGPIIVPVKLPAPNWFCTLVPLSTRVHMQITKDQPDWRWGQFPWEDVSPEVLAASWRNNRWEGDASPNKTPWLV